MVHWSSSSRSAWHDQGSASPGTWRVHLSMVQTHHYSLTQSHMPGCSPQLLCRMAACSAPLLLQRSLALAAKDALHRNYWFPNTGGAALTV